MPLACSSPNPNEAPENTPLATSNPEASVFYGDAAQQAKWRDAVVAKGPKYEPRSKHRNPDGSAMFTNRLILETSPYLLQHAHNPVNWFPWGDDAFALAKRLNRPVFLSVGYATCHWCHVMEEESFEDLKIAAYLNEHYICIKLDREERPDVDAVYMRSVQLLTGSGGWPMSVWLTPNRRPFYAGTYFPPRDGLRGARKGFATIIAEQQLLFRDMPAVATERSDQIAARIRADMRPPSSSTLPGPASVIRAAVVASRRYDPTNGGARGQPKFPSSFPVRLLLRIAARSGDNETRDMALTTLRRMASGGMYDHVGGGFHRYSTDPRWLVPHFEKMLYDNALLAVAYLEGHQLSPDERTAGPLATVATEILDYVIRDMSAAAGAYYSATDADSLTPSGKRKEGYYFTWTPSEIRAALGEDDARIVKAFYDVRGHGNFEGRSILHTPKPEALVARQLRISVADLQRTLQRARPKLLAIRNERPKPIRDDKIQVSWNGLMISAMARAARVLGEPRFAQSATRAAGFILDELVVNGRLKHSITDGQTSTAAFAEDYAFLSAGLLDLFEATQQTRWLTAAVELMEQLEQHHAAEAGGYYRGADDHEQLLAREVETHDGAIPAASSVAALTLLRLSTLTTDSRWRQRGEKILRAFSKRLEQAPWSLDLMMLAVDYLTDAPKEIVIVLPKAMPADDPAADSLLAVLRRTFLPNHVFVMVSSAQASATLRKRAPWAVGKPAREGLPTAYVCRRGTCKLPTTDPRAFAKQISELLPYPGPSAL